MAAEDHLRREIVYRSSPHRCWKREKYRIARRWREVRGKRWCTCGNGIELKRVKKGRPKNRAGCRFELGGWVWSAIPSSGRSHGKGWWSGLGADFEKAERNGRAQWETCPSSSSARN